MSTKLIPIAGYGYTESFFDADIADDDLDLLPQLEVDGYHTGLFAFQLDDDGLSSWGLSSGDYLLFDDYTEKPVRGQIILVRSEASYIIRQAQRITPDTSILSTPGDIYPPIEIPSENIRIIGVMSGFIKPHDELKIIREEYL